MTNYPCINKDLSISHQYLPLQNPLIQAPLMQRGLQSIDFNNKFCKLSSLSKFNWCITNLNSTICPSFLRLIIPLSFHESIFTLNNVIMNIRYIRIKWNSIIYYKWKNQRIFKFISWKVFPCERIWTFVSGKKFEKFLISFKNFAFAKWVLHQ